MDKWNENLQAFGFNMREVINQRFIVNEKITDQKLLVIDENINILFQNQNENTRQVWDALKIIIEKADNILNCEENHGREFNKFFEDRNGIDSSHHRRMMIDHEDIKREVVERYR